MFLSGVVKIENRGDDPQLSGVAISATCPDPAHLGEQLPSLQAFSIHSGEGALYYAYTFALP
jgi:hypothetical protein